MFWDFLMSSSTLKIMHIQHLNLMTLCLSEGLLELAEGEIVQEQNTSS